MMLAAIPVRNPIITECDTNLVKRPSRISPAAIITTPVRTVNKNNAAGRSAAGTLTRVEPAASAAALDVLTIISRVLVVKPPASGPAKFAYRPYIGLTPASTAAAMPLGIQPTALVRPAIASARRWRRSGRRDLTHRPAAPAGPLSRRPRFSRRFGRSFRRSFRRRITSGVLWSGRDSGPGWA